MSVSCQILMKKPLLGENCPYKHRDGVIVYICTGLVSACSIDICHCIISLWSVLNRKGRLTFGQQYQHCCGWSFLGSVTKYCAGQ